MCDPSLPRLTLAVVAIRPRQPQRNSAQAKVLATPEKARSCGRHFHPDTGWTRLHAWKGLDQIPAFQQVLASFAFLGYSLAVWEASQVSEVMRAFWKIFFLLFGGFGQRLLFLRRAGNAFYYFLAS